MRVLVTGGAGFIGSHVCERFLERGAEVVALDCFDPMYPREFKESNLSEVRKSGGRFALVEGDIRDEAVLARLSDGPPFDRIIHLAARAGVRQSIDDPEGYLDVNLNGTLKMLEFARRTGAGGFVFASSSSVYGDQAQVPFTESDRVDMPVSPYAATKKAGENLCFTYQHLYQFPVTCLRFFTVYGPRQRPEMAIHKFARLIRDGQEIPVFGYGKLARDYTFVKDLVAGIEGACETMTGYHVYNLGNAHPASLMELIESVEKAMGAQARLKMMPEQPGDVHVTFASIDRAREELKFEPKVSLAEGIAAFVRWYQEIGVSVQEKLQPKQEG